MTEKKTTMLKKRIKTEKGLWNPSVMTVYLRGFSIKPAPIL